MVDPSHKKPLGHGRKLFLGSSLNTVNLFVSVFCGLLITPWMMHAFGDRVFGVWSLVASFMGYYGLLDLGLSSAIGRFVSRAIGRKDNDQINEVISTGLVLLTVIGLISFLATLAMMAVAPMLLKESADVRLFNQLLAILSVNIALGFPCYVFDGILTSHLRFDLLIPIRIVSTVARTILTYYFIQWDLGIAAIAVMTVVLNLVEHGIKIVMAYAVDPALKISPALFRPGLIREMGGYGVYTFIAKAADILRFQIVAVVLTAFVNVAAVTHYRVASRLIEYFMQLIIGITTVFNPYFSQKEGESGSVLSKDIRDKFFFASRITAHVSMFVGLAMIFYGKDFIVRWVGKDYEGSYTVLVILTVPLALAMTQSTTTALLYGISKHKFVSYSNITEGIVNLILSLSLVKTFGMLGAAWAMAVPFFISKVFIQPWYVSRVLHVPVRGYAWTLLKPVLISAFAFAIPAALLFKFLRPNFGVLLAFSIIHLALYAAAVMYAGFLPDERARIIQLVYKRSS